jgi:hypothetical protein
VRRRLPVLLPTSSSSSFRAPSPAALPARRGAASLLLSSTVPAPPSIGPSSLTALPSPVGYSSSTSGATRARSTLSGISSLARHDHDGLPLPSSLPCFRLSMARQIYAGVWPPTTAASRPMEPTPSPVWTRMEVRGQ